MSKDNRLSLAPLSAKVNACRGSRGMKPIAGGDRAKGDAGWGVSQSVKRVSDQLCVRYRDVVS
jgi:hypothetical protein